MSEYYAGWDNSDAVFRGQRTEDAEDRAARDRKEPVKMVVPVAHAQINTFVAFLHSMFTQRDKFFELTGTKDNNHKSARIGEALLERDLNHNKFSAKLYQYLLDVARFGLGVFKVSWVKETQRTIVMEPQGQPIQYLGMTVNPQPQPVEKDVTKFLGNRITNISPYRFFPDTRLPLNRFQEGEFCASEDEYSWVTLRQMEAEGTIAGLDHVKMMSANVWRDRGETRLMSDQRFMDEVAESQGQSKGVYILTEVIRVIIPSEYEIDGEPLGPEKTPVKYIIWYVNDNRIVRCEPLAYIHDSFPYTLGQYTPDMHELVNIALAGSIDNLQSVITWFINSRITNVRKVIQNQLVVDPEGINMDDVRNRSSVIRLKPQQGRLGMDRWIKQLDIRDVTGGHVADAAFLKEMTQETTGITENALGQFSSGRRSATEAKNVNSGATLRLKLVACLQWIDALAPLGEQMLTNLRQGLDEETTVKVVGLVDYIEGQGEAFLPVTQADIMGPCEFVIYDGTLPSDKVYVAQVLQELLMAFFKSPEVALSLQIDPHAVLLELMELRGVRNPRRFLMKGAPNDGSNGANPGTSPGSPQPTQGLQGPPNLPPAGAVGPKPDQPSIGGSPFNGY